ncbi:hypothetical protein [Pseudonocardia acaciae]|uniref:hypothetical protein n=1 Tax=Pseudonocardia acaciae TaxID=551276 RepID=UPI0006840A82|nr:hypothetical protein [Pseudonocardia acaciae]
MIENRANLGSAVALFFLAPLVGEYLLGNTPITDVGSLFMFAPMYGGGALLIREVARRLGRGWATIVAFAAAYALLEEGPIDMMLWNPTYGGFDIAAAYSATYVPALGTSAQMLQDVLTMHTIWSICVPIALVEAFRRDRARPWLGKVGLTVTAVVFVTGSAALCAMQVAQTGFVASAAELAWSFAAIAGLVALGLLLGARSMPRRDAAAPTPAAVGLAAFGVTSLAWSREFLPDGAPQWAIAVAWCALAAAAVALCVRWCRAAGWGATHRVALAGGALLTYVWVGCVHAREMAVPRTTAVLGNVVFGVAAIGLLVAAVRASRR